MGLDQYLTARRFLWIYANGEGQDADIGKGIRELLPEIGDYRPRNISIEVGYWRKANAIHKWFVDNCQDGIDDCREVYVGREDLEKLLGVVNEVLADITKANELLPSQGGFFFGSTDYEGGYQRDLKDTKKILEKLLFNKSLKGWDFYYRSSW